LPSIYTDLALSAGIFPFALDVARVNWRDGFTIFVSLELGEVGV
jgi:hypothetical protein